MDEKTKIIHEIESQLSGIIQHVENFAKALKELVPKVIEEKEVVLVRGQIYKFISAGYYKDTFYLLFSFDTLEWTLINLTSKNTFWGYKITADEMKRTIRKHFTLCPNAKIDVIDIGDTDFTRRLP